MSFARHYLVRHEIKEINSTLIWVEELNKMHMTLNRGMCNGDTLAPPNKPIEQVHDSRRSLLSYKLVCRGAVNGCFVPPRRFAFSIIVLSASPSGLQCMSSWDPLCLIVVSLVKG